MAFKILKAFFIFQLWINVFNCECTSQKPVHINKRGFFAFEYFSIETQQRDKNSN